MGGSEGWMWRWEELKGMVKGRMRVINGGWEGWMENQNRWIGGWERINGRMRKWEEEESGLMEDEKRWMGWIRVIQGWMEDQNDKWDDEKRWMRGWQRMNGRMKKDECKDEKGWMGRWKRMNGKMWRDKYKLKTERKFEAWKEWKRR